MVLLAGLLHQAKLHCCTLQAYKPSQPYQVWGKGRYHASGHPETEPCLQITHTVQLSEVTCSEEKDLKCKSCECFWRQSRSS